MSRPLAATRFPALLLLLGSALFIYGGSHHPLINSSISVVGSPEFYRTFAQHIVDTPRWEEMHVLILLGPVLWALGAAGVSGALPDRGRTLWSVARAALGIGAALWTVDFVFDGFVAPVWAREMVAPGSEPSMTAGFRANQQAVIRLGLFSLMLIGGAAATFGAGLLATSRTVGSRVLAAGGLLIGAWPFVAWRIGEFEPGPFTSTLWTPTALLFALWFAALGIYVLAASGTSASTTKGDTDTSETADRTDLLRVAKKPL